MSEWLDYLKESSDCRDPHCGGCSVTCPECSWAQAVDSLEGSAGKITRLETEVAKLKIEQCKFQQIIVALGQELENSFYEGFEACLLSRLSKTAKGKRDSWDESLAKQRLIRLLQEACNG